MFAQVKAIVKSREKRARARQRAKERLRAQIDYYDFNLVAVVLLLTCFGLVILYSTSAYVAELKFGDDMAYFGKQALISVVSILFALVISRLDYHLLMPLASYIYLAAVVLMVLDVPPTCSRIVSAASIPVLSSWLMMEGTPSRTSVPVLGSILDRKSTRLNSSHRL